MYLNYASRGILTAVLLSVVSVTQAGKFSEIVVFGESSSDTGNVFEQQCPSPPEWGPWAPCTDAYFDGNLTSGLQWVEFLADLLRLPRPEPSVLGGSNYAHAGAKTGNGLNPRVSLIGLGFIEGSEVPGVLMQLGMYLQDRGGFDKKQLVIIWGGANDLRDVSGPDDVQQVVENLYAAAAIAACNGARYIMLPNQLNASVAPAVPQHLKPLVEALVIGFNAALREAVERLESDWLPVLEQSQLAGWSLPCKTEPTSFKRWFYYVDMFSAGETLVETSRLFGSPYSNILEPAVNLATFEIPEGRDVNEYLFLDPIHVTTPGQQIFARTALRALEYPRPGQP